MADPFVDPYVEFRAQFLREHIDVIDAVVQATPGATRASVIRQVIAEWVEREVMKASLIAGVRRGNGNGVAGTRSQSGNEMDKGRQ